MAVEDSGNCTTILYKSDNFLVVHKPYDLVINSNNPGVKNSLQLEIKRMLPNLVNPRLCHDFHFVHRLDYATSGVICIALNKESAKVASKAFEKRQAKKYYLALLHGAVKEPYMLINQPIGEDVREKNGNRKMCTANQEYCEKPKNSFTGLLVLERGLRCGRPATKVLLCPGTGRRHQLRVHCSFIGHTIIGDYTYSDKQDVEPYRQFLHSLRLRLENEIEYLDVKSVDPFDASYPLNEWEPVEVIRKLDDNAINDINKLTTGENL